MSFLDARRAQVAKTWALTDEIVLVPSGDPVPIPGTDEFYPFRAHPDHRYLADGHEPGHVLVYDAKDDTWTRFAPRPSADDRVWHSASEPVGRPLSELDAMFEGRSAMVLQEDATLTAAVTAARRIKDEEELTRLRAAAAATAEGFATARKFAKAGKTEFAVEAELEVGFLRGGGDRSAFDSIVAAGRNAAVLHAAPSTTKIAKGDFVLIDAGAAVGGYSCDCTRTFVVGDASDDHAAIHAIVLKAQQEAIAKCKPGVEYRDLHLGASKTMAKGLVKLGVLKGKAQDLVDSGAISLFFPHGLGHLIGLCTHDPGGYAAGRTRSEHFGLRYLRADLPLEAGMVVTIEPGLYFIEALLHDPERRAMHKDEVNWERADELLALGGVRIEDSVHVTDDGPEVLTEAIPHDV